MLVGKSKKILVRTRLAFSVYDVHHLINQPTNCEDAQDTQAREYDLLVKWTGRIEKQILVGCRLSCSLLEKKLFFFNGEYAFM